MKYIAIAIAVAIVSAAAWVWFVTPPCNGDYEFSIGAERYFLFKCIGQPAPSPDVDPRSPLTDRPCRGPISTVLDHSIAEVNRRIPIEANLGLVVRALSATETDISIVDSDGNSVRTVTMRAGRIDSFTFDGYRYELRLNLLRSRV